MRCLISTFRSAGEGGRCPQGDTIHCTSLHRYWGGPGGCSRDGAWIATRGGKSLSGVSRQEVVYPEGLLWHSTGKHPKGVPREAGQGELLASGTSLWVPGKAVQGRCLADGTGRGVALWVLGEAAHHEMPWQWCSTTELPNKVLHEAAHKRVPYAFDPQVPQEWIICPARTWGEAYTRTRKRNLFFFHFFFSFQNPLLQSLTLCHLAKEKYLQN